MLISKQIKQVEVEAIFKAELLPTPKPMTYASVLAAPSPSKNEDGGKGVLDSTDHADSSTINTCSNTPTTPNWVELCANTTRATSPDQTSSLFVLAEIKAPPQPLVWDDRLTKFGSRVNRQPLNQGIPFSQGVDNMKTGVRYVIVKTDRALQVTVGTLVDCWKSYKVTMIIDLEGENLCDTDSTTDVLTVYYLLTNYAFIVQLAVLGRRAFDVKSADGHWTLAMLLEDLATLKGLWDARNDAAGLHRCYGVKLKGVIDVQLMRCKFKRMTEGRRKRLEVAMMEFVKMTASDRAAFEYTEHRGRTLWNPDLGGDFAVFREEELCQATILYCLADVVLLGEFMEELWKNLTKEQMAIVREKSKEACNKSFSKSYDSGWTPRKVANPFNKAGNMRAERLRLEREVEDVRRQVNPEGQDVDAADDW